MTTVDAGGNWGRWGADDERGAANLLTGQVVLAALSTVRAGRVVPLAMPISGSTSSAASQRVPHMRGRPLPQHFMSVDGADYAAGARPMPGGIAVADDMTIISPHGTTTHIDALAHMWRGDQLYNGHPAERIRSYGATRCGIDKLGAIVTRGVLLDVATHLGTDAVDPDVEIDQAMLAGCAQASGVAVRAGDVVVVRTGWPTVFDEHPQRYQGRQPGLAPDAARWLLGHDVVAIGCDNVAVGRLRDDGTTPDAPDDDIHMLTLWASGVYLIELLWLEELSAAGATDFLFVAAPLRIAGGTASALTPLAVL